MSKTLLLLNGQTVILTNDASQGIVEGSPGLAPALLEEPYGEAKMLQEAGVGRHHHEDTHQDLQPSVVQMKVHGREVPGVVVGEEGAPALHKVLGHPLHLKDFELLGSNGGEEHVTPAKREGGFVQLPVASLHGTAGLEEHRGRSLGGDVFAITTNSRLLPPSTGGKTGSCGPGEGGGGEVQGLGSLVHLPLVAQEARREEESAGLESQDQGGVRNLSTVMAIIQGQDGSTQTLQLNPQEACGLNLPQLLPANTHMQALSHPSLEAKVDAHHQHDALSLGQAGPSLSKECSSEFPEAHEGRELVGMEGEDVSLGPFLLVPEYNSDGTISHMLQIRGSDTEAVPQAAVTVDAQQHSTGLSFMEAKTPALTPPHAVHNAHKIRLPLAPKVIAPAPPPAMALTVAPMKQSCPRAVAPKVSGNTYLRDVAKRTKFRNLTSLLEGQPDTQASRQVCVAPTTTTTTATIMQQLGTAGSSSSSTISLLTPEAVQGSSRVLNGGGGCSVLQTVPAAINSAQAMAGVTMYLPQMASASQPGEAGRLLLQELPPSTSRDDILTIKVNTGPITASNTTTATTITTAAAPQPPPIATPAPSIKCAEYSEGAGTSTLQAKDTTSLTSIVYCNSGKDEAPFAVHLPGGDSSKPLGSSENPIQLVQQGNTFQALQPVQERQLEQITSLLQRRRITAPPTSHHDEIYDPKTNMKIIYKVVYPEDVLPEEEGEDDEEGEEEEEEEDLGGEGKEEGEVWEAQPVLEKKRGRKPKDWRKPRPTQEELDEKMEEEEEMKKPVSRTRSGRISRPPRHMLRDFRHLHSASLGDEAKDRDAANPRCINQEDDVPPHPDKTLEHVIPELPRRKKREMPSKTILRYTCATCGKLYMGRIEAHYRKFPDHFRKLPPSPEDPKQSYSALKTLSDPAKPGGGEGSEINKSVLSPTPGTPASETHGEPGLPMETLTPQLRHPQEDPAPGDLAGGNLAPVEPQEPPARGRPGRGRRRGRGRKGRRGRPARVVPPTTAPNIQSPTRILEKILSVYTPQDIQGAVGHRLYQDLSPWQLLCLRVDREGASLWQDRLRILEDLLRECREEFHSQTEPLARPTSYRGGDPRRLYGGVAGHGDPLPPASSHQVLSDRGGGGEANARSRIAVKKEENSNFEVSNYLAGILGVTSREYQLKHTPSSPPSPSPQPPGDSYLPRQNAPLPSVNYSHGKRSLEDLGSVDEESPPKKRDVELEDMIREQTVTTSGPLNPAMRIRTDADLATKKSQYGSDMDCVASVLDAATCNLELASFTLPGHHSISTHPLTHRTQPTTHLPVSLPHLSSECVVVSSSTTLTTTHPAACSTHTSSLPLEIPNFSTNSTSPLTLTSCLPLTAMDTTFIPTTMPQVNTNAMQHMPLGDMDITAEDLPRLLSEGTGLGVGGGDGCDAPKLLDTSGDTSDLSEMLFKLQEATASISQSQENNLGSHMYQESVNGGHQLLVNGGNQLLTPQGLHTPGVSLTAQDYSTVGSSLNQHPTANLTLKLDSAQARQPPSMPLLTFSGALNSNFHSDSGMGSQVSRSEDSSKISALLCEVSSQLDSRDTQQNGATKEGEGDRITIGFGATNIAMSEFEDLLKR